ncbi:hypothetical protein [[Eubacterium] cellulosolvens]
MPERCVSCGGHIEEYDVLKRCTVCNVPYHRECFPDVCIRCNKVP